jgi:hypothetical protein
VNASVDSASIVEQSDDARPLFFPVSTTKLVVLSVLSFGLYELFWFYKNWCLVRERERSNIQPFWRAFFGYFFCYSLFDKVQDEGYRLNDLPSLHAGLLAAGWIICNLLWKLPDPYWLVCFAAVLFIVPVQRLATRINISVAPNHDRNTKFTPWNWAIVAVGGIILALDFVVLFVLPADPK